MHQGKPILFQKECCMCKRVAYILEKTIVSREYCISLKQFIAFKETPRLSTHSRGNTILLGEKDRYIHKKNQSWNLEWCFNLNAWGNLAPFLKRWCTFLKENIADSYQHTHITSKNVVITTIRYMQMDLNLTWCWNLLAEGAILLWSCIRIEDRFQNIAFLEKYNLGSQIGVYILCKKKLPNPCPECTLFAWFCFIFRYCLYKVPNSWENWLKINEIQNCPQPMPKSLIIWFFLIGDQKAGTSRSHDVGRYEQE